MTNMKKRLKIILLLSFLLIVFSCANSENTSIKQNTPDASNDISSSEIMLAKFIANTRLNEEQKSEIPQWTEEAEITKVYEIYTPGIEGVSHFEFKIEDKNGDAGYILVSNTEYDIPIPEMSTTGLTVTEQFIEATGTKNLKMIRFDFIRSAAESNSSKTRGSDGELLAYMGFNGQGMNVTKEQNRSGVNANLEWYYTQKHDYKKAVELNQSLPMYNTDVLRSHYQNANEQQRRGTPPTVKSETAYLNQTVFTGGWRTPQWGQHKLSNGAYVGCGPTAWAMVYAYWKEAKGKSLLFEGKSMLHDTSISIQPIIRNVMYNLRVYMGTIDTIDLQGLTWPDDMPKGREYGRKHGYGSTTTSYHTIAGDWTGGMNFAYNTIKSDKPLVLYFGPSEGLHYGVVEGVSKRYWSNTGLATELGLLVNYGWHGNTRKWVYAFSDTWQTTTACFDLFSISSM